MVSNNLAKKPSNILRKFLSLSLQDKCRFLEALTLLTLVDAALRLIAVRHVTKLAGELNHQSSEIVQSKNLEKAKAISRAVTRASKGLPHHPVCFAQAITVQCMLRIRRMSGTLYLGVSRNPTDLDNASELTAHAWVRMGSEVIIGYKGYKKYTPVAYFSAEQ